MWNPAVPHLRRCADRKSTRLNSSHSQISYAVFCLKKKNETLESGVASFIRADDYEYYCSLNWPKRTRRDSKYALLFRCCLFFFNETGDHRDLHSFPTRRSSD